MTSKKDVFLCHTSGDKKRYVTPFVNGLQGEGITYWVDEAEIKWGEDIVKRINEGLKISRFVVVFLSKNFIGGHWPEAELASALCKENASGDVIVLPILIEDENDIFKQYPLLRQKRYVKWRDDVSSIVAELKSWLRDANNKVAIHRSNDNSYQPENIPSKKDLLGKLQSYGGMLQHLKDIDYRQWLNLSLHNRFAMILLGKYALFVRAEEEENALHHLQSRLKALSLPGESLKQTTFYKQFPKDIKRLGQSVETIQQLIDDIIKLVEQNVGSSESADEMLNKLNEFFSLCHRLYSIVPETEDAEINDILARSESETLEFKSTMQVDVETGQKSVKMKQVIAKTLAGFMNNIGGILLIGVDDDGNPIGLDYDLKNLKNKDNFVRSFSQIVFDMIGKEYHQFLDPQETSFKPIDGMEVFKIKVNPAPEPAFVVCKSKPPVFFVRMGSSTVPFNVKEAINYYKSHWRSKKEATFEKE
jgi:hypothetical protein